MNSKFITAVSIMVLWCLQPAAGVSLSGVEPDLLNKIRSVEGSTVLDVTLKMEYQAEVPLLLERMRSTNATAAERHFAVITALREAAGATQSTVLEEMEVLHGSGKVLSFKGFWISNMIEAAVRADAVEELAEIEGVGAVYLTPRTAPVEVVSSGESPAGAAAAEYGPRLIKADSLWMLGITGAARVVGHIDYGMDGNHPALADRWRGNFAPPEECWLAPGTNFPFDSSGHGTQTMGALAGRDSNTGDTTGVAIDALWISARIGLDIHSVSMTEALQWMADPDGDPGTLDDVPDVVSNSWIYLPETECYQTAWDVIDNVEAAGAAVLFSAGNAGPSEQTVASPGSRNTSDTKGFSVGAVNESRVVADFSSRGPSSCDGVTRKPEVTTLGVGCRTTTMGGGYRFSSGTSIACPYAAGVVALLRQVNPEATVEEIQYALLLSAEDRGTTGDDNSYGMGIVDAYAAAGIISPYRVAGTITDRETGQPLIRAEILVLETGHRAVSDLNGLYELGALLQEVRLVTEKFGYYPDTSGVLYLGGPTLNYDVELSELASGTLEGTVTDSSSGEGVQAGVILLSDGEHVDTAFTDPNTGAYIFEDVPASLPPLVNYTGVEGRFLLPYPASAVYNSPIFIEPGGTTVLDVQVSPARVLVADDDGGSGYEKYFLSSIDTAGRTYYHHDVHESGESVAFIMDEFPPGTILIWYTGDKEETLTQEEQDSLSAFLGRDGRLFLTGQNIAEDLSDQGSEFLSRWLHAAYVGNTELQYVEGIPGDPVLDGSLLRTRGSGGADNQYSRDVLVPDGFSTSTCFYTMAGGGGPDSAVAGLLVDDTGRNGSRIFYLGFGFEAVNKLSPSDSLYASRSELMGRILEWLEGPVGIEGDDGETGQGSAPRSYALSQNFPNPFNPVTTISFDVTDESSDQRRIELKIYDSRGRFVRTLINSRLEPGPHKTTWDGRNDRGERVSSGVYFYVLSSGGNTYTRKMVSVK